MALQDQFAVGFAYCGEICVFVHAERLVGIRGKRIRHNDRPFAVASRRRRLNEVVRLVFIKASMLLKGVAVQILLIKHEPLS